ncbi:MAG: peptidase S8, partial [Quisquiliibacterium sp.]
LGQPVSGATVTGLWSGGTNGGASCITGTDGTCTVIKSNLKSTASSVTFTITDITGSLTYQADDNQSVSVTVSSP